MRIEKLIVELPDEVKQALKVKCAKLGKSQKEVVTNLIKKWLKR